MTLTQLLARFPDDATCKEYLTLRRWPDGKVACPRCGETKRVYRLKTRPFHWVCKNPSKECPGIYRFSVLTGSIFENTNIKLRVWFQAILLMCHAKKGISALQLQRDLGLKSYESVWYMCHRIRAAMQNESFFHESGVVEVDETYVGGKAKGAHPGNRGRIHRRRGGGDGGSSAIIPPKTAVIGAIARKGNIVCKVIEETDRATLQRFVNKTVSPNVSLVATDEHPGYARLNRDGFTHAAVNHRAGEYVKKTVVGSVHTANLDSFWSLLKRGVVGSFHKVSKDYLPLYLAEFTFRHNHRDDADIFGSVVAGC